MELSAGTRLGPYEILRRIGAGGMGVVYGALDTRLGRQVAIKVLPAALVHDEDRLRRFEKEARTIGALNHPNLVTLHDVGEHAGAPYLVTELVTGTSLRRRIDAAGKLPLREALRIATDIARGLAAAHGAGVIHRDIKPDNLFVTDDGRVKILDFGIAKLRRDDPAAELGNAATLGGEQPVSETREPDVTATGTGVVVGTPGYMAPEQLTAGTIDARTDLFALGVVMFEMVAGKRPFAADTHVEESYAVMKQPPHELPAGVPISVARVIARCLEKRPDARFQTAADLAFALDAVGETHAAPTDPRGRPSEPDSPPPARAATRDEGASPDAPPRVTEAASTQIDVAAAGAAPPQRPRASVPRLLLSLAAVLAVLFAGIVAILKVSTRPRVITNATSSRAPNGRGGMPPMSAPVVPTGAAAIASLEALGWPGSVGGGAQYRRVSYHTQRAWYARFARDHKVLFSVEQPDGWRIAEVEPGKPAMRQLEVEGRLLDIASTDELAVLQPDDTLVAVTPGTGPRVLAKAVTSASYAPDGRSLAITRRDGIDGSAIEFPIGTVLARGANVAYDSVRVSRDGQLVAVVEHDSPPDSRGRLLILDAKGNHLAESPIYPGIEGVAWSPSGGEVWFSEWTDLHALAPGTQDRRLFQSLLPLELRDVAVDGRLLVAPLDMRFSAYVGALTGAREELGWFDAAVVKSLSADGRAVAFLLGTGVGQDTDGYAAYIRTGRTPPIPVGHAFGMGVVPDGSAVVLLTAKPGLRVVSLGASPARDLPLGPLVELDRRDNIEITRDGTHAIVRAAEAKQPMRLYSIDLSGAPPPVPFGPALGPDVVRPRSHPVSPDGHWLALATASGIRLVPVGPTASTGKPVDLPIGADLTPLRFSSDSKGLFVQVGNTGAIERVDLAPPLRRTPVTRLDVLQPTRWVEIQVSADTSTVAYAFPRETADLYVIEPPSLAPKR